MKMQAKIVDADAVATSTKGMSGAEVIELCRSASRLVIEEEISTGKDQFLETSHFMTALESSRKSITPEVLKRYEEFTKESTAIG